MKLIQIVAVWLVALVTGIKSDFASEFIKLPDSEELNAPYHRQIVTAVEKLKLPDDLQQVRRELRSVLRRDDLNPVDKEVYQELVALLDESSSCPAPLIKLVKSIVAQIRADSSTPLAKLTHFIVRYGRRKMRRCANHIESLSLIPGRGLERRFDGFIINALALDPKVKDEKLVEKLLANTNLARARLDSDAIFKFVRRHKVTYRGYRMKKNFGNQQLKDRSTTHLRNFLDVNCIKLDEYLGRTLDIINLAQAFGSRQKYQARLLKLSLYHRFCLIWSQPKKRARIEENILKQSKKPRRHTELKTRVRPSLESIPEDDEEAEEAEEAESS